MQVPPVRAVLYLRVSTEDQAKFGFSLPEQRRECQRKARELAGEARLETFEFEDHSSGAFVGEGLEAAREFIRGGSAELFICLDPTRFARDLMNQLLVYEDVRRSGCKIVFVQTSFEDSPEGKLFLSVSGAISEYEKAKIRDRTMRGKRGKLAAGGIPQRVEPYGYRWDKDRDVLTVIPEEAGWVRQVFAWAAGETGARLGSAAIAQRLNGIGVPSKTGKRWHRARVRELLRNSVYKGQLVLNRYDWTGLQPLRRIPRDRRPQVVRGGKLVPTPLTKVRRPPAEWHTVHVPAIVSAELWDRVARLMDRDRRGRVGLHLLSGLVVCDLCGRRMYYCRGQAKHWLVACYGRNPRRVDPECADAPRCPQPHRRAAPIEAGVWERVTRWLCDEDELARGLAGAGTLPDGLRREAEALRRQVEQARAGQTKILYLVTRQTIGMEVAEAQLRRLAESIRLAGVRADEIAAQLARAHGPDAAAHQDGAIPALEAVRQQVRCRLESAAAECRRELISTLIREVRVFADGSWQTYPHCP